MSAAGTGPLPWRLLADRSRQELGVLSHGLLSPAEGMASKILCLIGISYLFVPLDLIPSRLPYVGHLDEAGFLLAGFAAAWLLAPRGWAEGQSRGRGRVETLAQAASFALRVLRADLGNFFLFQHRTVDGFLVTGKNSGTHWLKFMLSCALARHFGVTPPERSSGRAADAIIGHPRHPAIHAGLPRIGSSHSIPSGAFRWRVGLADHKPVVVFVRDIRQALLSNYVKWQPRYGVTFSQYLRGDPAGVRYVADIWWYVHFFNRWGDLAQARPGRVLIVRYEQVQQAPALWLERIGAHLGVALDEDDLRAGLAVSGREAVRARLDPDYGEVIVPDVRTRDSVRFSAADEAVFEAILARHLRHGLGYDYPCAGRAPRSAMAQAGAAE